MNVKKILVPIDFSENSINALRYAAGFAKSNHSSIFLLHITDPESLVNELMGNLSPDHLFEVIKKEEFLLGIKTLFIQKKGKVSGVILSESTTNDIDLIVMGTRGAGNIARNLFGTNTTKVVGKSECPVLVIPDESTYRPMRKVVMAVDLENKSDKLIEEFLNLIKTQNASVLLVYVGFDEKGNLRRNLEKLTDDLKSKTNYNKIVCKIIDSDEFPMILEVFVKDIEADMLAMITHHRGVFESIFDPGETKLLTYHTTTPLLIIPQNRIPVFFF